MPALAIALAVTVPLIYLIVRCLQADRQQLLDDLWRLNTLEQLGRTGALTASVLAISTLLAFPIAWLTAHTTLPGRRLLSLTGILPLAVPSYITAYAMLSFGGYGGPWYRLTGHVLPLPNGYVGSVIALSLFNMPYMYLNLRCALGSIDPSLEEAARSLGLGPVRIFLKVILPQLRPALLGGGLLVCLHVIGDFGVVSLMDYETFSYALYHAYANGLQYAAAAPALLLIGLAVIILIADAWFLHDVLLHRTTANLQPKPTRYPPRGWTLPAYFYLLTITLVSVILPTAMVFFWLCTSPENLLTELALSEWQMALGHSLTNALPAAVGATLLAIPIAFLARRYPSNLSMLFERFALAGYAVPALAMALSLIFLFKRVPVLYQSFGVLILAYSVHFLAEAVGPIRTGLYLATPRYEQAARSLGYSQAKTMVFITVPLLRSSLVVAMALVFLSVMKELPLTMLLAPSPYNDTLATLVYAYSQEALFHQAAPFALCILVTSTAFVVVLMWIGQRKSKTGK